MLHIFRWDLDTTNVRLTLYDKSVGVMDQTIGVRGAVGRVRVLAILSLWKIATFTGLPCGILISLLNMAMEIMSFPIEMVDLSIVM